MWHYGQVSNQVPYVPFINIAPVIAGTNGISPIFLTTVGVTGGIGVSILKNWVKQKDADGNTIRDEEGRCNFKGRHIL